MNGDEKMYVCLKCNPDIKIADDKHCRIQTCPHHMKQNITTTFTCSRCGSTNSSRNFSCVSCKGLFHKKQVSFEKPLEKRKDALLDDTLDNILLLLERENRTNTLEYEALSRLQVLLEQKKRTNTPEYKKILKMKAAREQKKRHESLLKMTALLKKEKQEKRLFAMMLEIEGLGRTPAPIFGKLLAHTEMWARHSTRYILESQKRFKESTLETLCTKAVIQRLTCAEECIAFLLRVSKVLFECPKIIAHCVELLSKNFSSDIYNLDDNPTTLDLLNVNITRKLTPEKVYKEASHLLGNLFKQFLELPQALVTRILILVWNYLLDKSDARHEELMTFPTTTDPEFIKQEVAITEYRKLRFLNFCLWKNDPHVVTFILHQSIRRAAFRTDTGRPFFLGPDHTLKMHMPDIERCGWIDRCGASPYCWSCSDSRITYDTAPRFYCESVDLNLHHLHEFLKTYIKKNWLAVMDSPLWHIVPETHREMLQIEQQHEMVQYYNDLENETRTKSSQSTMEERKDNKFYAEYCANPGGEDGWVKHKWDTDNWFKKPQDEDQCSEDNQDEDDWVDNDWEDDVWGDDDWEDDEWVEDKDPSTNE